MSGDNSGVSGHSVQLRAKEKQHVHLIQIPSFGNGPESLLWFVFHETKSPDNHSRARYRAIVMTPTAPVHPSAKCSQQDEKALRNRGLFTFLLRWLVTARNAVPCPSTRSTPHCCSNWRGR